MKKLAKIRHFDLIFVGKHGGGDKKSKLEASIERIEKLSKKIKKFKPDVVISFGSPEAARISFGLGIKHIMFCDSPHANAVMRLTLPLIQKLLIPYVIPKKEFSKFGINEKDIVQYKAIDAVVTMQRKINQNIISPFKNNNKKNTMTNKFTLLSNAEKVKQKIQKNWKREAVIYSGDTNQEIRVQGLLECKQSPRNYGFERRRVSPFSGTRRSETPLGDSRDTQTHEQTARSISNHRIRL